MLCFSYFTDYYNVFPSVIVLPVGVWKGQEGVANVNSEEECAYAFSKAVVIVIFVGFIIKPIFAISFYDKTLLWCF